MKQTPFLVLLVIVLQLVALGQQGRRERTKGILLEDLSWIEAEQILKPETIVVIPLGAAAKEHGPHLKLKNDWIIAEYLKNRILESSEVVVAPRLIITSIRHSWSIQDLLHCGSKRRVILFWISAEHWPALARAGSIF